MLHPHTELRMVSEDVGYGVFATQPIPAGTLTWALDDMDQIFDPGRDERLGSELRALLECYSWKDAEGFRILCWDFGRFMNHSCEANSFSPGGFDFEIAVRDIAVGEEITCDYGALNLERPLSCRCGSPVCRTIISSADFEAWAPVWDHQIRNAFGRIRDVPQPLGYLITHYADTLDRLVMNPESVPSILEHRLGQRPSTRSTNRVRAA